MEKVYYLQLDLYPIVKDIQLMKNALSEINREVNTLPYVSDPTKYQSIDFWERIDKHGGDCEDFALEKLNRLLKLGWPIEKLRLACCFVETGEYHAVLAVDTDEGQIVLDNRFAWPMTLEELKIKHYTPDIIQEYGGAKLKWCKWKWQ